MITKHYYPNKHRPRWILEKVTDSTQITLIHLGNLYCQPGCGHPNVYGKFTCTFYFNEPWADISYLTGLWRYKRYKRSKRYDA